ncbi:peptidylprolyl isomerase [Sphingomonas sp. ID1715]|uniref:peptidylprolyl isomerase n=1 Tax=Sphingomonas sp. ID1715 TaxID=1656898 RepID=UPI001488BDCC|nr:peptidylprolyl isomerase [Sphingomonas sp. ID1715]NNM75536.1 peptidylprolyl isomerase [Sphingomonas sp. ID1715]
MMNKFAFAAAALLTASPALAGPKVAIETSLGTIVAELYDKQAPITAANFLRYVVNGKFDGTTFYRAARNKANPKIGYVQGGIDKDYRRAFFSIDHEPTSKTGLKHTDGTLSMARNLPGTAMGEFFITVGPAPYLDARPGNVGYAAFGRVLKGMDVAKKILASPTWIGRGSGAFKDQIIKNRVKIIRARRIG